MNVKFSSLKQSYPSVPQYDKDEFNGYLENISSPFYMDRVALRKSIITCLRPSSLYIDWLSGIVSSALVDLCCRIIQRNFFYLK